MSPIITEQAGLFAEPHILLCEHKKIVERRTVLRGSKPGDKLVENQPSTLDTYYAQVNTLGNLSALCLSGGGIRSAAFALGAIQGLAARGILQEFDYLSTVSGGGYIGGWLTAWVQNRGYAQVTKSLLAGGFGVVDRSPIDHLRRYSSYLFPRKAIGSTDFLSISTLYFRNLILNWLVIFPLIFVPLVAIKFLALIPLIPTTSALPFFATLSITLIGWALVDSLRQRPGWESKPSNRIAFAVDEALPMTLGAYFASVSAYLYFLTDSFSLLISAWQLATAGASIYFTAWIIAFYFRGDTSEMHLLGSLYGRLRRA